MPDPATANLGEDARAQIIGRNTADLYRIRIEIRARHVSLSTRPVVAYNLVLVAAGR